MFPSRARSHSPVLISHQPCCCCCPPLRSCRRLPTEDLHRCFLEADDRLHRRVVINALTSLAGCATAFMAVTVCDHDFPVALCAVAAAGGWQYLPTSNELERPWHPPHERACSFVCHHRCLGQTPMSCTVDMAPRSQKTRILKVWRILVVAHAYKPTAYPPDRARVLRLMHRVARYFAACSQRDCSRGERVLCASFEAISMLCSSCRSGGPMLRSFSHATSVGS